jgi:hypothetical protein
MATNQKYLTAENIYAKLALVHKRKIFNIEEIVEWCAECILTIIGDTVAMYDYTKVKCIVNNQKALLPCNVYRLLDVFDGTDNRINLFYNDGIHLVFNSDQTFDTDELGQSCIYINYYGVAVDSETGYPLILKDQELACQAYCVWKLYYEDYLTGQLNGQQWQFIDHEKMIQCEAAKGGFRHTSNDEMKAIMNVVHNMVPNAKQIPLFHLNNVEEN